MRPSSTRRSSVFSMLLRGGLLARFLHEQVHLVRALRALADPLLDRGDVQFQPLFRAGSAGIEIAEARDIAAVARVALVGHHDVVERTTLGACARKTNLHHVLYSLEVPPGRTAARAQGRGKRAIVTETAGKARYQSPRSTPENRARPSPSSRPTSAASGPSCRHGRTCPSSFPSACTASAVG